MATLLGLLLLPSSAKQTLGGFPEVSPFVQCGVQGFTRCRWVWKCAPRRKQLTRCYGLRLARRRIRSVSTSVPRLDGRLYGRTAPNLIVVDRFIGCLGGCEGHPTMTRSQLVAAAALLGLANHAYFRRYEPQTAHYPLAALLLQPIALMLTLPDASLTLPNALIASISFLGTLSASIVAYRLSPFHPLAHVPGPLLAKISKLWGVNAVLSSRRHLILKRLHDEYGDIVRIGPNEVSVIHADGIRAVLGSSGFPKGQYYEPWTDPTLPARNLLTLRGDAHANRRRIWNRAMSTASMKDFEAILANRITQLLGRLDEFAEQEEPFDIAAWFSYLTVDFMGDMAFGGGFELLRDGRDSEGIFSILKVGVKAMSILSQVPWLTPSLALLPGSKNATKKIHAFTLSRAKERVRAGPQGHKDLWYHLMDEDGHEKTKPSMPEVLIDGGLTIVAGSDTSSMALNAFMWCILAHPDIYARAQAEVDAVYPEGEGMLSSDRHAELPFLNACFQEALRLYPPVPSGGGRRVPAGDARLVGDTLIPDGTQVFLPHYVIHRSAANFAPAPDSFDPDRWLRAEHAGHVHNAAAFIPFSYGAANCAAKHLAWRELLMTASAVLRRYDVRFAQGGRLPPGGRG
ncbi:hypothetical protein MIND_01232400 [Mycena indigotica]|uniref:Cytochrome P450 n=1 Tax=Mycena indigotica TaxID=2126181 RepID=A0A8H6S3K5_9AGAR|nr:uncharacterized protein MIND_01232400 [Mycena indigotica]KAF7292063.1 hypothetical protein MIND_01232400 [Mycena indigotica]